jgi:tetratricopeptide (TPR) repeat protein
MVRPTTPMPARTAVARDQAERSAAVRADDDRRMRSEALEAESSARVMRPPVEQQREAWPPPGSPPALTGEMATIKKLIDKRDVDGALAKARDWHVREPGNVLALIALGDALEAKGSTVTASRIYGSIIDLFPGRADMRRFAGERLARLAQLDLMIDTYKRAVTDRPDHLTGHRLLAYAYERAGKHEDAFKTILNAMDQQYRSDSYRGAERVLAEDAGMLGAAFAAASPNRRADIIKELHKRNLELATKSSTRFILYWETDANDVDFHIQDARGGHAFYSSPDLPSGGSLYADITTGFGPECFAIEGTPKAGPYRLSINYYSQGPMGYGMGLLEIQRFDGKGGLSFEDRPYVIMNDHAYVDLGKAK